MAIRATSSTVQATLVEGEAMDMRVAGVTRKLTPGTMLQLSLS